jgi:hypothetical protein
LRASKIFRQRIDRTAKTRPAASSRMTQNHPKSPLSG